MGNGKGSKSAGEKWGTGARDEGLPAIKTPFSISAHRFSGNPFNLTVNATTNQKQVHALLHDWPHAIIYWTIQCLAMKCIKIKVDWEINLQPMSKLFNNTHLKWKLSVYSIILSRSKLEIWNSNCNLRRKIRKTKFWTKKWCCRVQETKTCPCDTMTENYI